MNHKKCFVIKFLFITIFISDVLSTPTVIKAPPLSDNFVNEREKDDLRQIFGQCLHKQNVSKCLKSRIIDVIDDNIQNNEPWSVNLFNVNISLNKNPAFKEPTFESDSSRSFEDTISQKLKNLMESRVFQVKLSDEDINQDASDEARKKKGGKHGNMMMMSGMALMAMFAQIFLSKLAFMSGAALLIAKIALLFSTLTGLKKSTAAAGGGEHVVYSTDLGKQGWQRSIQTASPVISQQHQQQSVSDDMAYRGHSTMTSYDGV